MNENTTLDAFGGGIASFTATGNVMITDSTLNGNNATGGNGGNFNNGGGSNAKGGLIYFEGGKLSILVRLAALKSQSQARRRPSDNDQCPDTGLWLLKGC